MKGKPVRAALASVAMMAAASVCGITTAAPASAAPAVRHVEVQFNINLNARPGQNDLSQATVCYSRGYTHEHACSYKRYGSIRPNNNGTVTPIRKAGEKLQPKYSYVVYWKSSGPVRRVYKGGSPTEQYHSGHYRTEMYLETLHINYSYK